MLREQAIGLKEINQAVNHLGHGTQQYAAMVEQSTAASYGLAREAEGLFSMIGQFRLHDVLVKLPVKEVRAKDVEHQHRPVISIARQRANRLIRVIGSPAAAVQYNWHEF